MRTAQPNIANCHREFSTSTRADGLVGFVNGLVGFNVEVARLAIGLLEGWCVCVCAPTHRNLRRILCKNWIFISELSMAIPDSGYMPYSES